MLVLLHGLGSDERDLMAVAPELDPRLTIITLRAPHQYGMGGYAWFDIQWLAAGRTIDVGQALESRDRLIPELEALASQFKPSQLLLGGFSQGAMMTMGVALKRPDLLDGAMLLSGRTIPPFLENPSPDVTELPFLVQHGTFDPVLPIDEGREMRTDLERLGVPLEYHEYPMGHEVNFQSLGDALRWIRSRID